jgi:hypothetical protein
VRGKQKEGGRCVRHGDLADWRGVVWAGAPMVSAVRRARLAVSGPVARLAFRRREADGLAGVTWALEGAEDAKRGGVLAGRAGRAGVAGGEVRGGVFGPLGVRGAAAGRELGAREEAGLVSRGEEDLRGACVVSDV